MSAQHTTRLMDVARGASRTRAAGTAYKVPAMGDAFEKTRQTTNDRSAIPGVRLRALRADRTGQRAGHAPPQPLPALPVEPARGSPDRRPSLRLQGQHGADRCLGASERRMVARAPVREVRRAAGQSHCRRRQRASLDLAGPAPPGPAAVPAGSARGQGGDWRRRAKVKA